MRRKGLLELTIDNIYDNYLEEGIGKLVAGGIGGGLRTIGNFYTRNLRNLQKIPKTEKQTIDVLKTIVSPVDRKIATNAIKKPMYDALDNNTTELGKFGLKVAGTGFGGKYLYDKYKNKGVADIKKYVSDKSPDYIKPYVNAIPVGASPAPVANPANATNDQLLSLLAQLGKKQ